MPARREEIPDNWDDIEAQLRDELDTKNGDRSDYLMHLGLRRFDKRIGNMEAQVNHIQDDISGLRENEAKRIMRIVQVTGATVSLGSIIITAVALL
jgi:hypothetical protein